MFYQENQVFLGIGHHAGSGDGKSKFVLVHLVSRKSYDEVRRPAWLIPSQRFQMLNTVTLGFSLPLCSVR